MTPERRGPLYALCLLSLVFFVLVRIFAASPPRMKEDMLEASVLMKEALEAVRSCRVAQKIPLDINKDLNATGLLGLETSPITTSLGNLEAKRTSANPNFAGLIVFLLNEAGVEKGDAVAIGASSSFPALIIASLCAAKAMDFRPLMICSLGASQWGANNPDFSWPEIQSCLDESLFLEVEPIALSLGGERDRGKDMSPEGRTFLSRKARESGVRFLEEAELSRNVEERMRLYELAAGKSGIKAFINIGGGYANMGTDSEILKVRPGLAAVRRLPPQDRRGVIFEMASRRIPVVHLLYIKGLCDRYGLPWDPAPLPQPGEGRIYKSEALARLPFLLMAAFYIFFVVFLVVLARREGPISGRS